MSPRYFIVIQPIYLPHLLRSIDPIKYAIHNNLCILDRDDKVDKENWLAMNKERKKDVVRRL